MATTTRSWKLSGSKIDNFGRKNDSLLTELGCNAVHVIYIHEIILDGFCACASLRPCELAGRKGDAKAFCKGFAATILDRHCACRYVRAEAVQRERALEVAARSRVFPAPQPSYVL